MSHMSQTVTRLSVMPHIFTSNFTRSCLWHDSSISHDETRDVSHYINVTHFESHTWLICVTRHSMNVTHLQSHMWLICVTRHSINVTHLESHMWLICVTWLTHMSSMRRIDAYLLLAVWAFLWLIVYTRWRRPIGYLKLQVIFRK